MRTRTFTSPCLPWPRACARRSRRRCGAGGRDRNTPRARRGRAPCRARGRRRAGRTGVSPLVPGRERVLLHQSVRLLARDAAARERQQHGLREHEAARGVEVRAHALGAHVEAVDQVGQPVQHEVDGGRRVGETMRSTELFEMSRSCHSTVFSSPDRVAAHHARQPGECLEAPRVALVRHGRAALLLGAEELLHLADLTAGQVAHLHGDRLDGPGRLRQRGQHFRVAVAGHDLRGDRGRREAELGEHLDFEVRLEVRERSHGAGELADRRLLPRVRQPRPARASSSQPRRSFSPNVVGSAKMPCVRPTQAVRLNSSARRSRAASARSHSASTSPSALCSCSARQCRARRTR